MGHSAVSGVLGVHGQEVLLCQLTASDPCPCQQRVHGGHALGVHIKGKDLSKGRAQHQREAVNRPPCPQELSNTRQADLGSCLPSGRVMRQGRGLGVKPCVTSYALRSFQWPRTIRATSSPELVAGCSSSCHLLVLPVGSGKPGPPPPFPPSLHTTLPSPLILQDGSQLACLVSRGSTGINDVGASNRAKEEGREAAGLQEGKDCGVGRNT